MKDLIYGFYENAVKMISGTSTLFELANLVNNTFGTPCIVVDAGYKVLAYSDRTKMRDEKWIKLIEEGGADEDTIVNQYVKDGYMDTITHADGAVYLDKGLCEACHQTSGPIFMDGVLQGFVSIEVIDGEKIENAIALNTLVCRLSSIIMKSFDYRIRDAKTPIREFVAKKIFSDAEIDQKINVDVYKPHINIKAPYLFVSMSCDGAPTIILQHLKSRIDSAYAYIVYKMDKKNLYLFCHHINAGEEGILRNNLKKIIADYNLNCGCSGVFSNLEDRKYYFRQSKAALEMAIVLGKSGIMYHYNKNYVDIILKNSAMSVPYVNAVPSEIRRLKEYDRENGSEYYETLKTYLYNSSDINKAAKQLHLHRNTIVYRMAKIEDIAEITIHDNQLVDRLRFGIKMVELREKLNILE